jgi:glutathione synthase/RimK-type ligase-like ATP-grasp enzyme
MRIAIHKGKNDFSDRWVAYCQKKGIDYKVVNCYNNDIIQQLSDCDALMWHHYQTNPQDLLIAKPILFSLQQAGKKVFPDFNTNWHFNDKLGQKYLLEAIGAPLVKSYVFFDKKDALIWAKNSTYPIIFKLRGGAGSMNVKIIHSYKGAKSLINKAFGRGFPNFDSVGYVKEAFRKKILNIGSWSSILKGIAMLGIPPRFTKVSGREYGYVYFQEFIPDNNFDIRVVVICDKAFAIKRIARKNDFRASGSGFIEYTKNNFNDKTIGIALRVAEKLKSQVVAFDFVYKEEEPLILEISYGFVKEGYDPCVGYWDKNLVWQEGSFDPYGWMVDCLLSNA